MSKPCKIEKVERHVIENKLLTALDDKSKVAILATAEDLDLFIEALTPMWGHTKAKEMLQDLRQLRYSAFPPPDGYADEYRKNLRN